MTKTNMIKQTLLVATILAVGGAGALWLINRPTATHAEGGHAAAPAAGEYERGPHRGRMLRDGPLALELTVFEDGVPPHYRVYAYVDDKPVAPQTVGLAVAVTRLGGKVDKFGFKPEQDYLAGDGVLVEPHSFDVHVVANRGGKRSEWKFASYEGRTRIEPASAEASGIKTKPAGPATINETVEVTGRIGLNMDRAARIDARFPGLVREVRKLPGDRVEAGEVIATIESNESLQTYAVKAPVSGTVLSRDINVGAVTGNGPLFEIGDLSTLWADLRLFPADAARVRPGQPVRLKTGDGTEITGSVQRILPLADAGSQTVVARVLLDNTDQKLRPGQMVNSSIIVASREVPLAVKVSGLQAFRDFTVVFALVGDTYEVRMLELGQQDGDKVEVLGGIEPGERYVTENSFLIKADIDKSGASHDH